MAWVSDLGPRRVLDLQEHLNYWAIEHVSPQEFQDERIASFFTIKGLFAKALWTVLLCVFVCFGFFCPSECVSECYIVQPWLCCDLFTLTCSRCSDFGISVQLVLAVSWRYKDWSWADKFGSKWWLWGDGLGYVSCVLQGSIALI